MNSTIEWHQFPLESPGTTQGEFIVATKDPAIITRNKHAAVVTAGYGGGRFYLNGERLTNVYAWAYMPPAPVFVDVPGHE